jgi:hypothetical protein
MLLVVVLAAAALTAVPTAAHAQYVDTCGFILDPPVVAVGGTVNIKGSLFGPNETVQFFIARTSTPENRVPLGTTTSDDDPDGNISASFPLPAGFDTDGEYIITVECPAGGVASNVLIVGQGIVTTTTGAARATALPVTGSDLPGTLARVGLVAIALGGIAVLATRRRNANA